MIPTPFELTGEVTSHEDETAFLAAVVADSSRLHMRVVGRSVEGRPIRAVTIADKPRATGRPAVMFVGSVHGEEYCSRESCLTFIRDLAFTDDPAMIDYLSRHTVVVAPTANPDGIFRPAGQNGRFNANGINVNRDYVTMSQPETRAIGKLMVSVAPQVVVDHHESWEQDEDVTVLGVNHYHVDPEIASIGKEFETDVLDHLADQGLSTRVFNGGSSPSNLRNWAAFHAVASLVVESNWYHEMPTRIAHQRLVQDYVLGWHAENHARISEEAAEVPARSIVWGQTETGPYRLNQAVTLPTTPRWYLLTDAQHRAISFHRTLNSINSEPVQGGWQISLAQPMARFIPVLLDPEAILDETTPAIPDARRDAVAELGPPGAAVAWGPYRVDGMDAEVQSVDLYVGGELKRIWPD